MKSKVRFKKLKILLFMMLSIALSSIASERYQLVFEKGNEQFARGKFDAAIRSYKQVVNKGYRSAALYFNLGNAYYRTGDIPSALLWYEKARKLDPSDEEINNNIKIANAKTTDKTEAAPEFFLFRWWRGFILLLPLHTLAVLSIVFVVFGSCSLSVYLLTRTLLIKKVSFYFACIFILCGVIGIFVLNRQSAYFNATREAIIFNGAVTVKSGPDKDAKGVFIIHSGTKVTVLEKNSRWFKIELPNGNTGWIETPAAREI